jgi:hypothetical protein
MSGRLRYTEPSFTLPACERKMSELDYELAVGKISQAQYDERVKQNKP